MGIVRHQASSVICMTRSWIQERDTPVRNLGPSWLLAVGAAGPPNGVGPLWTKTGGADGTASQLMVCPGTEVFVTRNSRGNPAHTTNDMDMLKAAWQASLVGN